MEKQYNLDASVHKPIGKGFRVKVSIHDLEMHINGMVVYPPSRERDEWTVYTPAIYRARVIEFAAKSPLWKEISAACISAVKLYLSDGIGIDDSVYDLPKEEFDREMSDDLDKAIKDLNEDS